MQFNSYIFILQFLPILVIGYFVLNKLHTLCGKWLLIAAGVVFYVYGVPRAAVIFGASIVMNLLVAYVIQRVKQNRKVVLASAILLNVTMLVFFKFFNFALRAVNELFATHIGSRELLMPLGISFFTFQQIMYLVSVYRGEIPTINITDYLAYILYFPKLLMGPLTEPTELISQLGDDRLKRFSWENMASGLKLFSFGLMKKMVLADTFSQGVSWGYGNLSTATTGDCFLVMLFYTFEIYFDFSGYTDMAVGLSQMLNITLPMNFDSPYQAISVRDFWKRWHMSLTRFFTHYIYFPLGGSRKGNVRTYVNIMIVFLISGFWHGSNWTFVLWGVLHGLLQVLERIIDKWYDKLHEAVKWGYTFCAVNILWLLFRSESIGQWCDIVKNMLTFHSMAVSKELTDCFVLSECNILCDLLHLTAYTENIRGFWMLIFILAAFIICLIPRNNYRNKDKLNGWNMVMSALALIWGILYLSSESIFVYFNF